MENKSPEIVELLIDVLQRCLDGGFGENILLADHLHGALADEILMPFDHRSHLGQYLTIYIFTFNVA